MKRVIITGGGTGGHVFPGIAVARELVKNPGVEVLYVGKNEGPEVAWVTSAGFSFEGITASGFPRGFSLRLFTFWIDFVRGLLGANRLISRFRPSVVFATGGYVSVPVSLAGAFRGVPVGLFEPNVMPGLAAKFLALFSKKIFTGFEETLGCFSKKKARFTGIPVREEIMTTEKGEARKSFGLNPDTTTLLMLGGSQGAHTLNRYMTDVIRFLGEGEHSVQIIMMTGWPDYRETMDKLEKCALKVVLRPFISNIHEAYAAADLVVARSGAMTCAEILSRGLPSIFVPYPHASGHQEANGRALEKAGAALVILEKELEEEKLSQTILALLGDPAKLQGMGEKAKGLSRPTAASDMVKELLEMAETK
ncbi:MAG TPA: undecaprenyldiphospho-muramoylpentapeptide beta-N-acetylglucosaminyltransferase [bacterium]